MVAETKADDVLKTAESQPTTQHADESRVLECGSAGDTQVALNTE